jgi:hypothetical protein
MALELSAEMIRMANCGMNAGDDDGALVIYGVITDCAYKIREAAARERRAIETRDTSIEEEHGFFPPGREVTS